MSALDAFMATWSQARATFGQGAPPDGSEFDQSAQLGQMQDRVRSAAPGSAWSGGASDSYADANSRQADKLGRIGELDRSLGNEVSRSAAVVLAGRRDLDAVRQWVVSAAATVPQMAGGQQLLWPIVRKGSADMQEIVSRANGELSTIAGRMQALGSEYQLLGDDGEGKYGKHLDKKPPVPNTTLDLDDITRRPPYSPGDPSTYGPPDSIEIGPGTFVPANNHPGIEPSPPKAPLDYRDIEYRTPYVPGDPATYGPRGYMELVPGSGAWVPDPHAPGFVPHPPEVPVDMARARILQEGEYVPAGMVPLYPGSRVAIPDPDVDAPR